MAAEQSAAEAPGDGAPVTAAVSGSDPGEARPDDAPAAGSAQPGSAAEPASTAGSDARPDLDEVKRKFRAALERKHGTHATAEGTRDTGKVHGSHGPAASRRSFRRKSG